MTTVPVPAKDAAGIKLAGATREPQQQSPRRWSQGQKARRGAGATDTALRADATDSERTIDSLPQGSPTEGVAGRGCDTLLRKAETVDEREHEFKALPQGGPGRART